MAIKEYISKTGLAKFKELLTTYVNNIHDELKGDVDNLTTRIDNYVAEAPDINASLEEYSKNVYKNLTALQIGIKPSTSESGKYAFSYYQYYDDPQEGDDGETTLSIPQGTVEELLDSPKGSLSYSDVSVILAPYANEEYANAYVYLIGIQGLKETESSVSDSDPMEILPILSGKHAIDEVINYKNYVFCFIQKDKEKKPFTDASLSLIGVSSHMNKFYQHIRIKSFL